MDGERGATEWVIAGSREAAQALGDVVVATTAVHCVIDWLGVAVAGSGEPLAEILTRTFTPTSIGEASVVGRPNRGAPWDVALVNGAAGHALDYDDTHMVMVGHPSAPVLPAVLALAERLRCGGVEVLAALVAGIEAECRLGALVCPQHYDAGFHSTGTLGSFGAAAAGAQLLGLDDTGWRRALGVAAAHAAGLKAQFGTMTKPFHAGRAAADGVRAALLAAEGFTASPDVVEAHQGFAAVGHAGPLDVSAAERRLGGRPAVLGTLFKYHAACYGTHATLENCLALRAEGLVAHDVDEAEVQVAPAALDICNIHTPATGLEGKFSLRLAVALGLLGDDTSAPATFSDRRVRDPEVVALRERVRVVGDAPGQPITWSALRVRRRDGSELRAEIDTGTPESDHERRGRRLAQKFLALTGPVLGDGPAADLLDRALHVADLADVTSLVAATRPEPVRTSA